MVRLNHGWFLVKNRSTQEIKNGVTIAQRNESTNGFAPSTASPGAPNCLERSWKDLSERYLADVISKVCAYNESALKEFIVDNEVRRKIQARLEAHMVGARERAYIELQALLKDEQEGILQTANHYFADTLSQIRDERAISRLRSMGLYDGQHATVNLQSMLKRGHISNEDQATYDIHDILKAYHKVALKRYTGNIIIQVVERHILGETGPVRLFTPVFVGELSNGELSYIAKENFATSEARQNITLRAEKLQKALQIARQENI